eukprot:symbB.v1.2.029530.t1/scaffold3233.1/size60571/6
MFSWVAPGCSASPAINSSKRSSVFSGWCGACHMYSVQWDIQIPPPKNSNPKRPSVQDDGDICLHTVAGDRVHVFASGHKQAGHGGKDGMDGMTTCSCRGHFAIGGVTHAGAFCILLIDAMLAMSFIRCQDEYVVATADIKGVIRVHRLLVRPRRNPQEQRRRVTNPEEEKCARP